jgi:phytoene dehydrogenase-like protein
LVCSLRLKDETSRLRRCVASGGGLALVEALVAYFEAHGGTILYETTARKLDRRRWSTNP